ncbi:3-dehydroquinate synthase [Cytobacillus gottheilii]|uniref:3-dehydroquinate synthase n=1 Tax=Cytobacillus gottheilii TaxID=859144 RepID=A0ABX8F6U8_9BACI|nr:3-dehydroquinate synthase [Cytobacillus gottheilii]QVY60168.1 3-dehydroquinate synthase [Cytobacillus gottheilii]
MKAVSVQTSSKEYPVLIGEKIIHELPLFLHNEFPQLTKLMIITDENIGKLYLQDLLEVLSDFESSHIIVPNGENAKTFEVYHECLTFALKQQLDRKSLILAFGGGAVGDLSGFVAATYMRGIPFIQIPTTILAHDSAVGGKVAINHELGKNMVGAFYQPEAVFYDLEYLHTLPEREKRSGFAEVIKHALIHDLSFYEELKEKVKTIEDIQARLIQPFLARGIEIKANIVGEDEKETGKRAFLNFGHTLGHAVEAEMGYGGWSHGEAIIVGMRYAIQLSKKYNKFAFNDEEFTNWLITLGYETEIPAEIPAEKLLLRMKQDKKTIGSSITFVLLEAIGNPMMMKIDDEALMMELERFVKKG